MVELAKTSIASSSDKILKDSSEVDLSESEGLRNVAKNLLNVPNKISYEEKQAAIQ